MDSTTRANTVSNGGSGGGRPPPLLPLKTSPTAAASMAAFRGSSVRSQSSVQLLGFIEHCIREDVDETTDEGELRVKGYETLINTSTSVLSCIQVRALCRLSWLEPLEGGTSDDEYVLTAVACMRVRI